MVLKGLDVRLDTPKRMGAGFAGVLLIAGATFYIAKRNIAGKRKMDLEEYRSSPAPTSSAPDSAAKRE